MSSRRLVLAIGSSCLVLAMGCNSYSAPQTESIPATTDTSSSEKPQKPNPISRWKVTKDVNELDHKAKVTILSSNVILRCAPKFEGYIIPDIPSLGHDLEPEDGHTQVVRYRIDDTPVKRQVWAISDDFTALFIPTATLRAAAHGKKLVVEFKPQYVSAQTQTFDFEGLADAARSAGCKF